MTANLASRIISRYSEENKFPVWKTMIKFHRSKTYSNIRNKRTGYWKESILFLLDEFKKEMKK